jgi:hypothetical protein
MELLTPMATVAIQSLSAAGQSRADQVDAHGKPRKIDTCYAYGAGRDLVKRRWPQFHRTGPSRGTGVSGVPQRSPLSAARHIASLGFIARFDQEATWQQRIAKLLRAWLQVLGATDQRDRRHRRTGFVADGRA